MSFENYDSVLDQLRAFGLEVESLEIETPRPVRVRESGGDREKRGWYWLGWVDLPRDDGSFARYITGGYGIWRGAENVRRKVELSKAARACLSDDQRRAIEARRQAMQKQVKAQRQAEIERAAAQAQVWWSKLATTGTSKYLDKKGVQGHGVRYAPSGALVIPMTDAVGKIYALEVIRPPGSGKLGKQFLPKGMSQTGKFHLLAPPRARGVVLLAEGYATAASVFESTGIPAAVAFTAGNLMPVAQALTKAYPGVKVLICADDDYQSKCRSCGQLTPVADPACKHCCAPHGGKNTGVEAAKAAAHAVGGAYVLPIFGFARQGAKLTDFNDLAQHEKGGQIAVSGQILAAVHQAGWDSRLGSSAAEASGGALTPGGAGEKHRAASVMSLDDAIERFIPIDDGTGKALFDSWTQNLVLKEQMISLLPAGVRWDDVKRHPRWIERGAYFVRQVGFDPANEDPQIKLNTYQGWPTQPKEGDARPALDHLRWLCSLEPEAEKITEWLLKWLALPIQQPGTKMRTALVFHGKPGSGKSVFFEKYGKIFGDYYQIIDQAALEDKFNADWAARKLYVVADEVVSRKEMYQLKNQLKALVTGEWVRVNPKNLIAYKERNHMNLVFLSNERQALDIEPDDRRYVVINTPDKKEKSYYDDLAHWFDTGGVEALHHYLKNLPLGDFHNHTSPPDSVAKNAMIDVGLPSTQRFIREWLALEIDAPSGAGHLPVCPCEGSALFDVYRNWCIKIGVHSAPWPRLKSELEALAGWRVSVPLITWAHDPEARAGRAMAAVGAQKTRKMVIPSDAQMLECENNDSSAIQEKLAKRQGETQKDWISRTLFNFSQSARLQMGGQDDE